VSSWVAAWTRAARRSCPGRRCRPGAVTPVSPVSLVSLAVLAMW
jgi:hypothetical protein